MTERNWAYAYTFGFLLSAVTALSILGVGQQLP